MTSTKKYLFIILFYISNFVIAQTNVSILMDSLVQSKDISKTVDLSFKIAYELKFDDLKRTNYYIDIARKNTEKINTDDAWKNYYRKSAKIYFEIDALDLFTDSLLKEYAYYKNTTEERRYLLENQLGVLYARLNDKNLALFYFNKLWKHYKDEKNYYFMAQTKNNIGTVYLNYGLPNLAIPNFKESLIYLKQKPDNYLLFQINTGMGRTYTKLKNYPAAISHLTTALSLINDKISMADKSWLYLTMSQYYIEIKDADKAIFHAHEGEKYETTKNTFAQKDILESLYKAYLLKKDYKKSAEYFQQYENVRSSLKIEEKAVNVEKLKIDYTNKIKAQDLELVNNKKRSTLIIAICVLIILLLILSIIITQYKNRLLNIKLENKLKEYKQYQLKQELEIRNKELAVKTIKETEQNELYQILINDLKIIQSNVEENDTKKSVNHVINMINQNALYNNWEEFELRFSNIYESYYEKLHVKHPSLSVLDKRICALIKLNLSTKEIANITKSSVRSIENCRTRLRKKLGLTNSKTELNKYLIDIL